jgi:hypothetical protein
MSQSTVSSITKRNWIINISLLLSALVVSLSGIYFLFFAHGGYQGGRNIYYGIQIIFSRHTWEDIHLWGGVLMISFALVHIPLHWDWIISTIKRVGNMLLGRCQCMNHKGVLNLLVDALVGFSFLLAAISGLYFLYQDIAYPEFRSAFRSTLLFSRQVWDILHTWSGVIFIAAATAHIIIHWKWIEKVSGKVLSASVKKNQVEPSNAVSVGTQAVTSE